MSDDEGGEDVGYTYTEAEAQQARQILAESGYPNPAEEDVRQVLRHVFAQSAPTSMNLSHTARRTRLGDRRTPSHHRSSPPKSREALSSRSSSHRRRRGGGCHRYSRSRSSRSSRSSNQSTMSQEDDTASSARSRSSNEVNRRAAAWPRRANETPHGTHLSRRMHTASVTHRNECTRACEYSDEDEDADYANRARYTTASEAAAAAEPPSARRVDVPLHHHRIGHALHRARAQVSWAAARDAPTTRTRMSSLPRRPRWDDSQIPWQSPPHRTHRFAAHVPSSPPSASASASAARRAQRSEWNRAAAGETRHRVAVRGRRVCSSGARPYARTASMESGGYGAVDKDSRPCARCSSLPVRHNDDGRAGDGVREACACHTHDEGEGDNDEMNEDVYACVEEAEFQRGEPRRVLCVPRRSPRAAASLSTRITAADDRRRANLIFDITGDERYRFRPATHVTGHKSQSAMCTSASSFSSSRIETMAPAGKNLYDAELTHRRRGLALSVYSVSYLHPNGSTLRCHADPVSRGAEMRARWRHDRFLTQRGRDGEAWRMRQAMSIHDTQ